MSNKEQRDAEIERLCDIVVAEENARLANGGVGPGDVIDPREAISFQEGIYRAPQRIAVETGEPPYRDEYRELIEAPASTCTCGPNEGCSNCPKPPARTLTVSEDVTARIGAIRQRVMSYDRPVREDVGFLLTVIDAYEIRNL